MDGTIGVGETALDAVGAKAAAGAAKAAAKQAGQFIKAGFDDALGALGKLKGALIGQSDEEAEGAVKGAQPKIGGIEPVEAGRAGEDAAGIRKNKRRIPSITGTAKYRVPDELTEVSLREIKNVLKLSNTNQLKDYLRYSQETGRKFILETRPDTNISRPLQNLIDEGLIDHRPIGG